MNFNFTPFKAIKNMVLPFFIAACLGVTSTYAQNGCTDPAATNYNAANTLNDGSCTYPATHFNPFLRAAFAPGVPESSGLVFTDGNLWTHNDSGNPNDIFKIDTTTGAILQTVYIDNFANTDWEAITADSSYIYVGNFGNNSGSRHDLSILKIAKADIGSAAVVHLNAQVISFSYADQNVFNVSAHNFDCEAMISVRDSIYLFTKDRGDYQTRVYKLSKTPGTYVINPMYGYNISGLITDASYNPTTKEIVLIGYLANSNFSFLWFLSDYKADSFFSGNKRRVEIGNGGEWQTEGICWLKGNRFFVGCEKTSLISSSFYTGDRSFTSLSVARVSGKEDYTVTPNPVSSTLQVEDINEIALYSIIDMSGKVVQQGSFEAGNSSADVAKLPGGSYMMLVTKLKSREIKKLKFTKL